MTVSSDERVPLGAMADILHLHPTDVRHEVEEGRLPAVRVGQKGLLFGPIVVMNMLRCRARDEAARCRADTAGRTVSAPDEARR